MPDKEKLIELAERVEALEGPDKGLDREIFDAVTGGVFKPENAQYWHAVSWSERQANHFTASLDTAMTLVPDGWTYQAFQGPSGQPHKWTLVRIGASDQKYTEAKAKAATPALALTAATLRAIAGEK